MGKSSSQKQGVVDYMMSAHIGIATKVDKLRRILINEKVVWEGTADTLVPIGISKPDLFGGPKKEGGVSGVAWFLPGKTDQVMPETLASRLGKTSDTCPAFRGISSVFFAGGSSVQSTGSLPGGFAALINALTGRFRSQNAFTWSTNSPIVAQNIWFDVERTPVGLDTSNAWINDYGGNPAHVIYEVLTSDVFGLAADAEDVDLASFTAAAATLYSEGFATAFLWNRQSSIEDFITEVLSHINATLYIDQSTGKWTLTLIRDDYDTGDLMVIDSSNGRVVSNSRRMLGETFNEIVASWTNPLNEETETVTLQDPGNIASQGGIVSDTRNYYGVVNRELALQLCSRELRAASAPLQVFAIEVNREGWSLAPGKCFIANFPDDDIVGVVARISSIDYGTKRDGKIKLNCSTDVFSLDHFPVQVPADTSWVDPSTEPTPLDNVAVFSLPYYFASSSELQASAINLEDPETLALVLGFSADTDTVNYDLLSRAIQVDGTYAYNEAGTKGLVDRVALTQTLPRSENMIPKAIGGRPDRGPTVGAWLLLGTTDANCELVRIVDETSTHWLTRRGQLDTIPRDWSNGDIAWVIRPGARLVDDDTIRAGGETANYKMLPRTSRGRLAESLASVVTATLTARPHLPLRPANVKVNGNGYSIVDVSGTADIAITWAVRNRLFEDGQTLAWTDGSVAGEYGQHTVLQVFDTGGTKIWEYEGLYTESSLTLPKTHFARWSSVRLRLIARKFGVDSLQGYDVWITGLANNGSAPLPPTPPAIGVPPSPTVAPLTTDFSLVNGPLTQTSGVTVPCIRVQGTPTNQEATRLLIRYREDVTPIDWRYHGQVAIAKGRPVTVDITAVKQLATYIVDIAYGTTATYDSNWVTLGSVTSGGFAVPASEIGGRPVEDVINDIATNAENILKANLDAQLLKQVVEARTYNGDGTSVQFTSRQAYVTSLNTAQTLSLLGAALPDASAFVLDTSKVQVGAGVSFASYATLVQSQLNGLTSSVSTLATAIDGVSATYTLALNGSGQIVGIAAGVGPGYGYLDFVANTIRFIDPDGVRGTPLTLLTFSGGQAFLNADVKIDGDLVVTGTITTDKIITNGITEEVTQSVGAISDLSTEKTVTSVTINPEGGRVRLQFRLLVDNPSSSEIALRVKVFRNGTNITGSRGTKLNTNFATTYVDWVTDFNPGTASVTYSLTAQTVTGANIGDSGGSGVDRNLFNAELSAQVFKR